MGYKRFRHLYLILLLFSVPVFAQAPLPAETLKVEVKTYDELLRAILEVRVETRHSIEETIQRAKVLEAWKTGNLIETHLRENHYTPVYGDHVTARLAAELGMSRSLLNRMRAFARAYPEAAPDLPLSWNDYILLVRVSDSQKRDELAAAAAKENWTYAHLFQEIREWRARNGGADDFDKLPEIPLPKTGVYPWGTIDGKKYYGLGFSAYLEKSRVSEAEIPPGKGAGEENFHTYEARVTRVVDGDTFRARITVGFGIVIDQRVRLKRIDAPEIQTEEGGEARALLEKILARDQGRVILQTFGFDQHGRTLANVWVNDKPVDQELVDAGLAVAGLD